jgi:hypothetical protein
MPRPLFCHLRLCGNDGAGVVTFGELFSRLMESIRVGKESVFCQGLRPRSFFDEAHLICGLRLGPSLASVPAMEM